MSVASLLRGPLIGTCLASLLYGITCLQAFFYFQTYVNDRRGLKLTTLSRLWQVALLLTLETIHVALSIWLVDNYLVVNYANERALQSATWFSTHPSLTLGQRMLIEFLLPKGHILYRSMFSSPFVGGTPPDERLQFLIDLVVYFYFTWRIWMCKSTFHWTNTLELTVIAFLVTSKLWIVIFMIFMALARTSRTLIITSNILFIIGDAFSASIMAWYLNRTRDHALRLVDIIALVLGVAKIYACFYQTLAQPLSLAFTAAILVQTRLYANSLLVS
ncbi:hypothetical protein M404DRAFT_10893 [Pisolithus tinctorius Marx 270]|uniref:Uncharacterized protein n=1 Tax=Pisolithus tinctorius Marx 270 TaxID=870435 RepID=A0A0C3NMU3_PISTI|nr:hypothetical protein M404DRAFT_10893 [Pisolithus tinctorius Marx 270]